MSLPLGECMLYIIIFKSVFFLNKSQFYSIYSDFWTVCMHKKLKIKVRMPTIVWNEQVCLRVLMDMTKEGKIWCTIWTQTFIMCVYWICSLDSSMWSEEMTETPSDSLHRQCLCPLFSSILSLMKPDVKILSNYANVNVHVTENRCTSNLDSVRHWSYTHMLFLWE